MGRVIFMGGPAGSGKSTVGFKISTELAAFYFDHFEVPSASEGPLTVIQ